MKARLPQQRGYMVREGADAPPHHEDTNLYQRQHQPISSILILRSIAQRCVSKDESPLPQQQGYMVRDGADAPPHHEDANSYQRQHQPISSILILRSRASGVSKDESPAAATAGLHGSRRR
jgi:hypothetical protein